MMKGRRPWASASVPENCRTIALPAAKAANARPATAPLWVKIVAANSGRMDTRTPILIQPWAKFDVSTARYAVSRHACWIRMGGSCVPASRLSTCFGIISHTVTAAMMTPTP